MKKKLIYLIMITISLFIFSNIEKVEALNLECCYVDDLNNKNCTTIGFENGTILKTSINYSNNNLSTPATYIYESKRGVDILKSSQEGEYYNNVKYMGNAINNLKFKDTILSEGKCPSYVMFITDSKNKIKKNREYKYYFLKNNSTAEIEQIQKNYSETNKSYVILTKISEKNPNSHILTNSNSSSNNNKIEVDKPVRNYKTGCSIFGNGKFYNYIKWAITLVRYLIPFLIAILGITEYLGVILSGEDKNMKEAQRRIIMRVVIGIIFLVLPSLLKFLINISGSFIGISGDDVFCGFI